MSALTWRPLWLGSSSRRLYAALHASAAAAPGIGVLMAPPLLHEQARSRRILVDASNRLAAIGLPCLRFDYFGTADSDGSGEQHDVEAMRADLDVADAALRSETGVTRVVVFAWRASALVAMPWLRDRDVAAVALWEPIVDGAHWLRRLNAADAAERVLRYGHAHADADDGNLMGFRTSPRWRTDMAAASFDASVAVGVPTWILQRAGDETPAALPTGAAQIIELPADAPQFGAGVGVESVAFLSRRLTGIVDALGHAFAGLAA
jgi:hypothetical protein